MSLNKRMVWGLLALSTVIVPPAFAQVNIDLIIGTPPPRERVEVIHHERPGYVWAPGYWRWKKSRHVWVPGRWIKERPGYRWMPERWEEHDDSRYRFQRGRWQRDENWRNHRSDQLNDRHHDHRDEHRDHHPGRGRGHDKHDKHDKHEHGHEERGHGHGHGR